MLFFNQFVLVVHRFKWLMLFPVEFLALLIHESINNVGCRETILGIAKHYESGEPLPENTSLRILRARTFRAGTLLLRQVKSVFVLLHLCILINNLTWYGICSCVMLLWIWNYTQPMFQVDLNLYMTWIKKLVRGLILFRCCQKTDFFVVSVISLQVSMLVLVCV